MTEPFRPQSGAFFDFSARAKFRLTGNDRLRFLNGQITNDVRKASATQTIEACVLSAKGKTNAHIFVAEMAKAFVLDVDSDLRESLPARLDRYIIADDVAVEEVTDEFALFHLLAETAPSAPNEWKVSRARRFLDAGWDVWVPATERESAHKQLSTQAPFCGEECAETFRIESGIPRWDRELTEEIIPIEAGLEDRCVDYEKGCYIGQEVISRIKMSGQTNKRLCGFVSPQDVPIPMAARLRVEGDEKEVGWISSATRSERLGKEIALGFVKRGFNQAGRQLQAVADTGAIPIEIVALPFLS